MPIRSRPPSKPVAASAPRTSPAKPATAPTAPARNAAADGMDPRRDSKLLGETPAAVAPAKSAGGSRLAAVFDSLPTAADRAAPENGFLEYTIEKDADGRAVLTAGRPVRRFGPEDHLPADVLATSAKKRKLWGQTLRNKLPFFEPLRHPRLDAPK